MDRGVPAEHQGKPAKSDPWAAQVWGGRIGWVATSTHPCACQGHSPLESAARCGRTMPARQST
eukprot:7383389-Prorocentrum_lima.AAC.1